jgi:hypothetical protein
MITTRAAVSSVIAMAACFAAGPALADTIYGSIRKNNQPVADTVVTLACGGMQVQGRTDGQGNYSLSISASGRCQLSVDNKSATVFLSREGSLYNFDVPAAGDALIQR